MTRGRMILPAGLLCEGLVLDPDAQGSRDPDRSVGVSYARG